MNDMAKMADHVFWKKGDPGLPDVLTDRNGDITLGLCKVCGQAEADLADSCPIIPADQWPEDAHLHTWDSNGLGNWHRPANGLWHHWASDIPRPAGHDWRVPVMRPSEQAPAIDLLQQAADVIRGMQQCITVGRPAGNLHAHAANVLALIDGQAMRGEQPAKGEGVAGE